MAHFAELDETNTVLQVVVVHNDVTTIDSVEDEQRGIDFLNDLYPESGTWVQTSYNANFRTRYAAVGGTYDTENDEFIPFRPFPSWVWNDDNEWEAPIPPPFGRWDNPDLPIPANWDEDTASWVEVTE
jgi:hypothetical protein